MKFTVWMIVYEKDKRRLENYRTFNKKISCKKFTAIDSVSDYDKWADFALNNNFLVKEYVDKFRTKWKGKIGCNLSHQLLLQHISKHSTTDWNLILEDDMVINNYNEENILKMLQQAMEHKSNYVQLYTNKEFLDKQKKQTMVGDNLYKMIYQWGACTFFINKAGINILKDRYPLDNHIDEIFMTLINDLNALCWINDNFINCGSESYSSKTGDSIFGSIIYGH